jgi:hypothetical protein
MAKTVVLFFFWFGRDTTDRTKRENTKTDNDVKSFCHRVLSFLSGVITLGRVEQSETRQARLAAITPLLVLFKAF